MSCTARNKFEAGDELTACGDAALAFQSAARQPVFALASMSGRVSEPQGAWLFGGPPADSPLSSG